MKKVALLFIALFVGAFSAFAAIPQTINYQGFLKNSDGTPVSVATNVTFSLYSSTSSAGAVWASGAVSVTPANGVYSLQLGQPPQPALPPFDRPYWLGVAAGADPEMRPLQPLDSAPYALRANVADSVAPGAMTDIAAMIPSVYEPVMVRFAGTGGGTVTSSPAGLTCTGNCVGEFTRGGSVVLTATADATSAFTGWSGSGCSGTGTCTVTADTARTVEATFSRNAFAVTVTRTGGGTVTSSKGGIYCGSNCMGSVQPGDTVTFTAAPDPGFSFAGWSGACTGSSTTCTLSIDAAKTVNARFTAPLSASKAGTGGGTITSTPAGINCGATCTASYDGGQSVTLTATPDATSSFAGWSGACSGTESCIVTVDGARNATATFTRVINTVTVALSGNGGGNVSSAPAGISCGASCSAGYVTGTAITLTATPDATSAFTGWTGCDSIIGGNCSVSVNGAKYVTAGFSRNTYPLTVNRTGGGIVSSDRTGIYCGASCASAFDSGTTLTLTATPDGSNTFVGWGGGVCSGTGSCVVTMSAARAITATFTNGTQTIQTGGAALKGLVVQGSGGQTANLQEWQDSGGSAVASVSPTGVISGNGSGLGNVVPADNSVTDAKISGTISGSKLGSHTHSGMDISSGTVADSRLSANVTLLDVDQTVNGVKSFYPSAGTVPFAVDASKSGMVANLNAEMVGGDKIADLDVRYGKEPLVQNPRANTLTTLDSAGVVGYYTSITIGADGLPVISYYDYTNDDLKVAKCGNAACSAGNTITTVDSSGSVGHYTSITIGTDGLPVISYYDNTNYDLKVAKCGNPACSSGGATLTTLDSAGDVGSFTSITIGTDGLPVISYYDNTNYDLKVAKCGNAACSSGATISTLDSAGDVGQHTSITIGTDGLPVISYYDNTNYDLKVAKCANAACSSGATLTTLDSAGSVGWYTSITIGADGLPVISYIDFTNYDLKVAKCGNADCSAGNTLTTVDSSGSVGWYTSITIGADGLPVISYLYGTNYALKVAKCSNPACSSGGATLTTLDSAGDVGSFTSITIGTDGLPVISYYDGTNFDLKVAKCANQFCLNNWSRR